MSNGVVLTSEVTFFNIDDGDSGAACDETEFLSLWLGTAVAGVAIVVYRSILRRCQFL